MNTPDLADTGDESVIKHTMRSHAEAYGDFFDDSKKSGIDERRRQYDILTNQYYDLATRFYRFGWEDSFHFAPLKPGQSLRSGLFDYELKIVEGMDLSPEKKVLDLGCGIGGPMINLAKATGAEITGLNNNAHQIGIGQGLVKRAGLENRCQFVKGDFMKMPLADESFDAIYSIEAVCHAPNRLDLFREVLRVLKPGGFFAFTDWLLTRPIHTDSPEDIVSLNKLLIGNGLQELVTTDVTLRAIHESGFQLLSERDFVADSHPDTPWYAPLDGGGRGWRGWVCSEGGRRVIHNILRATESLRLVPRGTTFVHEFLSWGAEGLVELGKIGVFTPLHHFLAQKPLR